MPPLFTQSLRRAWSGVWPAVADAVREHILVNKSHTKHDDAELAQAAPPAAHKWTAKGPDRTCVVTTLLQTRFKAHNCPARMQSRQAAKRLSDWPSAPELDGCGGGLYTWARAKLLYSLKPADKPFMWVAQQPLALAWLGASLCPFYFVSLPPLALLLLFIDKSDEYQLISFIALVKAE